MRNRLEGIKRIKFIQWIITISMAILLIRLGFLTLVKGAHYREVSENLSIKDIYIAAPRGEIRDRNGILLAGNKPIFTLQIIKDDFNKSKSTEKNMYVKTCIEILEKNGADYVSDFPIKLNQLVYSSDSDYLTREDTPLEEFVDIFIEENLIENIIDKYYKLGEFYYFPVQNILNALEYSSIDAPFDYTIENNSLNIEFSKDYNIERWKRDYFIEEDLDPKGSLIRLIDNDRTIIRKLLSHPITRKMAYEEAAKLKKAEHIELENIMFSYDSEYKDIKRSLMKDYPEISMDSTATQDFIIIFEYNGLEEFLKLEEEISGVDIKNSLEEIFKDTDFLDRYDLQIKEDNIIYSSKIDPRLSEDLVIKDIKDEIIESKLTEELLEIGGNKSIAQNLLVSKGINPRISVVDGYKYVPMRELDNFKEFYSIDSDDCSIALEQVIEYYDLDKEDSIYLNLGILNIYEELKKPGQLSYMPINISYDLNNSSVAQLEEKLYDFPGFKVSVEPIRSYPEGTLASHVLGYMGKISSDSEIKNYIDEQGYTPDTIIGKTGIEEAYEKYLYGKNGYRRIEVDPKGNTSSVIEEIKPVPGDNVYLSLDYNIQRRAELSLEGVLRTIRDGGTIKSPWGDFNTVQSSKGPYKNATSGAVVVADVKTGEILAMASYPGYDPNLFATGITSADWNSLKPENEKNPLAPRPLYNIATQTAIQPGSTFKMITALAALDKGLDPSTSINCTGYITIGDTEFGCWIWNQYRGSHGPMNLIDAIRDSCNYYFYTLALGENVKTGSSIPVRVDIEDIANVAKEFGLGQDSGLEIRIPKEATPGVPDPVAKNKLQIALLRNWLNVNIEEFYIGEKELTPDLKEYTIDEILDMMKEKEIPNLQDVYNKLADLNLDGTKHIEGSRDTLADYIKFTFINEAHWNISDTINVTIGQGANQYTLSQMVNYVSGIANDGNRNKLTLINNIKSDDNREVIFKNNFESEEIDLNNLNHLEEIRVGMYQASMTSLNRPAFEDFPVSVALKTGTAERSGINPDTEEEFDPFSYMVAFAPYENPEIAIGVVLFQGGSGANCSPIVREIVAEYMGLYREDVSDNLPIEMDIIP